MSATGNRKPKMPNTANAITAPVSSRQALGERQIESAIAMKNRAKKICCPLADNNFCEMKMDPRCQNADARIQDDDYDSAFRRFTKR